MADPSRLLSESAWTRARRDFARAHAKPAFLGWLVLCEAVAAGLSVYWSDGESLRVRIVVTVVALLLGAGFASGFAFLALWLMAPKRQRDDARTFIRADHTTPRHVRWRNIAASLSEQARREVRDPDRIEVGQALEAFAEIVAFLHESLGGHGAYELTRGHSRDEDPNFDLNLRNPSRRLRGTLINARTESRKRRSPEISTLSGGNADTS